MQGFEWDSTKERKLAKMRGCVFTVSEACRILGIPLSTIYEPRNKVHLQRIKEAIGEAESSLLNGALVALSDALKSEDERMRVTSAKIVLDRNDKKSDRQTYKDVALAERAPVPEGVDGWAQVFNAMVNPRFATDAPLGVIKRLRELRGKHLHTDVLGHELVDDFSEWDADEAREYQYLQHPEEYDCTKDIYGYGKEQHEWLSRKHSEKNTRTFER